MMDTARYARALTAAQTYRDAALEASAAPG